MTWPACPACDSTDGFDYSLGVEEGHSLWPGAESGDVECGVCRSCDEFVSLEFTRDSTTLPSFLSSEDAYDPEENVDGDSLDRNIRIEEGGKVIRMMMTIVDGGRQTGEWESSFRVESASLAA